MWNMPIFKIHSLIACICIAAAAAGMTAPRMADAADDGRLQVLFLGDAGHHRPADRARQVVDVLARRGIDMEYTEDMIALSAENLAQFDCLLVYANQERILPAQEKALLDFVANGKGLAAIHCASYCFLNSDAYIELVGAQFRRHGTGVFRTEIIERDHPIMQGFGGFESWDETYVHHRHNEQNRTVLSYRVEGDSREPWTWVRTHGKGRVFYTAWGHDQRTWGEAGFQNLLERGIRWSTGGDPAQAGAYTADAPFSVPRMTPPREDVEPFQYVDVGPKIPNYTPNARWGTQGEAMTKMQQPLSAEESIKHFVTPVDFETQLFASEPQLGGKPIAMNWDERGRLWVCETYDYPNQLQPSGQGRDRIRICEDTNGDGRADKFTIFAEKLSIPTAIVCYRGGVIVQDGTHTLFLKDTDGDDRADVRRVLIDNWRLGDTHGGVSNFQYGLDNWIWAMQGYNDSRPTVDGQAQARFRMGFFRFKLDHGDPPSVTEIEFIRSTDNNTWGLGFSEEGLVFGSTANRNPSVFMPIANRYYERVRGWAPQQLRTIADTYLFKPITRNVRQVDQHGGYTAGAGHALYTARVYPRDWWNRTAFVCGPTGHLVGAFVLKRDGADYSSTSPFNLLASDDEWSAPIMAEVGPDGNVWVIDWYNYIVQHNPTPRGFETGKGNAYESDLRDKKHGRIYRVVYRGETSSKNQSAGPLSSDDPDQLVAALSHPTMLWRKQAQRLLIERGKSDVVPALVELAGDDSVDEIGLNVGVIHALWTLQGLDALEDMESPAVKAAVAALRHPSAGVRRNAANVLPSNALSVQAVLQSGLLNDSDPQVRLAALLALADMPPSDAAGKAVAKLLQSEDRAGDRWLADATTSAAAAHAGSFLSALAGQQASAAPSERMLETATIVAEHVARSRPSSDQLNALLPSLASAHPQLAESLLAGLGDGWPRDHDVKLTAANETLLINALDRLSTGGKGRLVRLGIRWGGEQFEQHGAEIVAALLEAAGDEDTSTRQRVAAARQLVGFRPGDDEAAAALHELVTPQAAPELAAGLIEALADSTAPSVGKLLVDRATQLTPLAREAALRVLLGRPATTTAFLDAVEEGRLAFGDLALDQRQALAAHPDRSIRRRAVGLLREGGGLPNPDRQKVLEELMPLTRRAGDVALGKEVFKKHCAKCHMHSGEGERIGPDLTGMAVHPKEELLTHMIDPSRSVEGNFRTYTVVTVDGRILTGMLAGESRTSIELIDAEAKRRAIVREDIDELIASRKSLMPDGFEKQASQDELVNLLAFLTARGRFLPLPLGKVANVVSTKDMFFDRSGAVERLMFDDWSPKTAFGVPFVLVDPQGERRPNVVMLYGPQGEIPPRMPRSVAVTCNAPAKAIHMLSGVSGWGHPLGREGSVTMIVRLHYADGAVEDHELKNGVHFADYIRRVDVPESKLAFMLRGQQLRYLAVHPQRGEPIEQIELVKGSDRTAPIVMSMTIEAPDAASGGE